MNFQKTDEAISKLTAEQYRVTQESGTERPFTGQYDKHFEAGIYVDIVSGEPLFASSAKFNSGCGWPSFSKPLVTSMVKELKDSTLGMVRAEHREWIVIVDKCARAVIYGLTGNRCHYRCSSPHGQNQC